MSFETRSKPQTIHITHGTAGEAVQVSSSPKGASLFIIQALPTNTGYIYVGPSASVSPSTAFAILGSGQSISFSPSENWGGDPQYDLSDWYISFSIAGEGANVGYLD